MDIRDFILRYGFVAGKRYTRNQKVRFLMGITEDFEDLGYQTEAKQTVNGKLPNMNLYIGNFSRARLLLETYFDTPPSSLGLLPYRYFHAAGRQKAWIISMLVPMAVIILAGIFYYAVPAGSLFGRSTALNIGNIFVLLLLLLLMHMFRKGFGKKRNIIRNTSSLYALYHLAEDRRSCKRTAFILTDNGCRNNLGASVCKEWRKPGQMMIHLDSVGAEGNVYMVYDGRKQDQKHLKWLTDACLKSHILSINVQDFPQFSLDYFEPQDIYLITGEMDEKGVFLRRKQLNTAEVSRENLEKVSLFLTEINENLGI